MWDAKPARGSVPIWCSDTVVDPLQVAHYSCPMGSLYYHGTCADNLASIMRDGLKAGEKNWDCSQPDTVYLWSADRISQLEGEDDPDELLYDMKERAGSTASIALAYAKDCRRAIFQVELDEHEVHPDMSARGIDGAVSYDGVIPPEKITRAWIDSESLEQIQGYFLSCRHDAFGDLATTKPLTSMQERVIASFRSDKAAMWDIVSEMNHKLEELPVAALRAANAAATELALPGKHCCDAFLFSEARCLVQNESALSL